MKKYLVVYAHPNQSSFSNALLKTVVESIEEKGNIVKVQDLNNMNFNPVLSANDLAAIYSGNLPDDIKKEQELIKEADEIVMIYPLWWTGLPAILKGWVDRVFTYGFAYKIDETGIVGLLKGKKAVLITTHGTPKEYYDQSGMFNSLMQTQDAGIFNFCGITEVKHFFMAVVNKSEEERNNYLAEIKNYFLG